MLCRPCFCAYRTRPDGNRTYASLNGLASKHWCTFPRRSSLPHSIQANDKTWQRQTLKNELSAHAKQETQDSAPDAFSETQHERSGIAQQYQLPLLPVTLIDQVLNCSAAQLWNIICQPDPDFQTAIHKLAGNHDVQHGSWQQQDDCLTREEQYTKSLKKNSIGPTEAFCIDQQQCTHRSNAGFAIERKVYTPKVPFGGSFHNLVHWCAWNEEGLGQVRLQVSCDVVFTNRWVPAKSIITSSSIEGMIEYYNMWLQELCHHLNFPNSPSQSIDALPPSGQSQPKLKVSPDAMNGSANAKLPYTILLLMMLWPGRSAMEPYQGSHYLHA